MTAMQIARRINRTGTVLVALNNLAALREAAEIAASTLPVKWAFEPGTPADIVQYLAGGAHGALKGAGIGLGLELLVAAVVPGVAFGYLLFGGAALGAIHGVGRVKQGWRVRMVYDFGTPLVEVQRAA
jgi:hypothetical protein